MDNRIYYVKSDELSTIKKKLSLIKGVWIAELDGRTIDNWGDYANAIEKAMRFPTPCEKSFAVYSDWMTDLDWLNAEAYALIIRNFFNFMSLDKKRKEVVIKAFKDDILPWWQGEIKYHVVEGNAKPFNVYLVD